MRGRRSSMVGLALVASCTSVELAPAPAVEVMGCQEWPDDGACAIDDRPLTLWVETAADLAIDDARLAPTAQAPVQGGLRYTLSARPGRLTVRTPGRRPFVLQLVPHAEDEALAVVRNLRRRGELDAAEAELAALTTAGPRPGAKAEAARNALAGGRRAQARVLFEASIAEARAAGRPRAVLRDRTALAYLLVNGGLDVAEARAQLDALAPIAAAHAEAAADLDYFETLYASLMRSPRPGLAASARLLARAERLGIDESILDGRQMRVALLVLAGRWPEVAVELEAMRGALDGTLSPCKRAEVLSNLGWYELLGHREARELFPEVPMDVLGQAAAAHRQDCPRPVPLANTEVNRGWAALFSGALPAARAHVEAAWAADPSPSPRARVDRAHLEAEIALAAGAHSTAAARLARLETQATQVGMQFVAWRARLARGVAHEGLGDLSRAIDAYRGAEAHLATLARRVPLGEGRDGLLFARAEGADRLVSALTRAGRGDDAIAAIRRARRGVMSWARAERAFRAGAADVRRDRAQARLRVARAALTEAVAASWSLPEDALARERAARARKVAEARSALDSLWASLGDAPGGARLGAELPRLPQPGPGEARLFVHPAGRGLVGWLRTPAGLFTATSTYAAPKGLRGLEAPLYGAKRLEVYAHPSLEALDWMGWPVRGAPLHTRARLELPMDLGPRPRSPSPSRPRALVIADPAGALPGAQAEGRAVAEALTGRGYEVTTLIGPTPHARVLEHLAKPWTLLHYSGHGVQQGLDGVEGGLLVQGELRISVTDVLALPRAPRRVVLAACDLGRRGTEPGHGGLGMPQALLLGGAEEVVAAVRPVDDRAAARWVEAFYAAWRPNAGLAEAARQARGALAADHDAAAFRVWTRSATTTRARRKIGGAPLEE